MLSVCRSVDAGLIIEFYLAIFYGTWTFRLLFIYYLKIIFWSLFVINSALSLLAWKNQGISPGYSYVFTLFFLHLKTRLTLQIIFVLFNRIYIIDRPIFLMYWIEHLIIKVISVFAYIRLVVWNGWSFIVKDWQNWLIIFFYLYFIALRVI